MIDKIMIGRSMKSFETSPKFDSFSKVKIVSRNDTVAETGDSTGRELELECSYGNETMATNILNAIKGVAYQPFNVRGAFANPAVELGDGVSVSGVYSGVYKYSVSFGRQMSWDISADSDEELEHEFGYYSEDGGYVTYSSLKNGTAAINGAGLIDGSVKGDDKLAQGSVSGGGSGGGGSGSIKASSLSSGDCVSTVVSGISGGNLANNVFNNKYKALYLYGSTVAADTFYIGSRQIKISSIKVDGTNYAVLVPDGGAV